MNNKYIFPAAVTKIYDADTLTITFDLGFGLKFEGQKLRLYGIDAYEVSLRGDTTVEEKEKGKEGRDRLREMIPLNTEIMVETVKTKTKKGKFGRYIVKIYVKEEQVIRCLNEDEKDFTGYINKIALGGHSWINMNDWLVKAGYAVYKEY